MSFKAGVELGALGSGNGKRVRVSGEAVPYVFDKEDSLCRAQLQGSFEDRLFGHGPIVGAGRAALKQGPEPAR